MVEGCLEEVAFVGRGEGGGEPRARRRGWSGTQQGGGASREDSSVPSGEGIWKK